MRKIIPLMILGLLLTTAVFGYKSDLPILEKEAIAALSDQKLTDTYVDTVVEIEAQKSFHTTSGFMPEEYKMFKDLLRYRINLIQEIHKRGLDVPATN